MKIDLPGIGGSLGECVLCGNSFALEVITGKSVEMINISGFSRPLPMHAKCVVAIQTIVTTHKDEQDIWKHLPNGPLKREYEKVTQEPKEDESHSV